MHLQVKLGIIPLYCLHQSLNYDSRFQFLPYLTPQRLFWRFPRLHLPPRKFPAILIIAIPPLSGKYSPLTVMNNRCYDLYLFHFLSSQSISNSLPESSTVTS